MLLRVAVFHLLLFSMPLYAEIVSYDLTIEGKSVNLTGVEIEALSISNQIPAPTLRAEVGDTLRVSFTNLLDEPSSVHWHGILLPPDQDGVPELNTRPILPGETHTFEFAILHTGTFWYHSHTELQIQKGVYGSIVLSDPAVESVMQEETVLFSDWIDEDADAVLANLKKNDEFYAYKKNAVQSWDRVLANGPQAISNRINSAVTRMGPMDLADVAYDAFLVNGARESNLSIDDPAADTIKLRLVNGSTSSYFDVEYAGGPMTVIAADGQDVEPILVQRLRMSTAETYDVVVPLQAGIAYELRASSFDGSGHSSLFVGDGERLAAPDVPPPNFYLMNHMSMDMNMDAGMDMNAEMDTSMDMSTQDHHVMDTSEDMSVHSMPVEETAGHQHDAGHDMTMMQPAMAVIEHMTDYRYLAATKDTSLPGEQVWREIQLNLTGSMERYVWSFNGRTAREDAQIVIRPNENVRIQLSNDTMMHHPLHLHGHFFRVVNQHGERSPLKHTVNVPPMGSVVIEFDANESQDWLFHCHNQYHMKAGMNRVISYDDSSLFNDQIDSRMHPANRWFYLNEFHLMSSFGDYEFRVADERHSFDMELDTDLEHAYELHLLYNYHFNQFFSLFAGFEKRHEHNERTHDKAIAGFNFTLPLLIESEWRFDDHGEFRVELESEIQLTRRWAFDWRWNTDDEHRYGFNYRLNNRFAITVHTDTEYGEGVGVQFYY